MEQNKPSLRFIIPWGIIMLAGGIILFIGLTHESLWFDESYTAALVNQNILDIINITAGDNHPPLYYLMLSVFHLVFGSSVLSLRMFSLIGALALAAWGIGPVRRALDNKTGIIYTLLTLTIPIIVAMAQETRMYTWAAFFVTGSALYGYLAKKEDKTTDWILFGICSLAAAYTHYYALLAVILIFAIIFVQIIRQKKMVIPFLWAAGAMIIGYLPWLIVLTGRIASVKERFWIPPINTQVFENILYYPFSNKFSNPVSTELVAIEFLIAAILIAWGITSRFNKRDNTLKMLNIAVGTYVLTIGTGIAASFLIRPVMVERYIVPVLGLFILALASGIASLGKRSLTVIMCILLIAISAVQIYNIQTNRFNGPMNEAVEYLAPQIQPGDVFLHTDEHTFGTFCYYFSENKNYYYQREGYEGFSNYDAFKPNGQLIGSLDEIGKDHRIWLIQRFGAADNVSASGWMGSGLLKTSGAPAVFRLPHSWYGFSIYKVSIGEPKEKAATTSDTVLGNLTITISGFNNEKGNAIVSIYNQGSMSGKPVMAKAVKIISGQAEAVLENLPYGTYAALAFHDENNNQQLDMNRGTPTEGFGYSNTLTMPQGPPQFENCKFDFDSGNCLQNIVVFYVNGQNQ